jgi:hypothetical protein
MSTRSRWSLLSSPMAGWHWIVRALVGVFGLWLFMQWQSIAAQWTALFAWLLCAGGAEAIIAASRGAQDRRRVSSMPLRGGRRRTDPPIR